MKNESSSIQDSGIIPIHRRSFIMRNAVIGAAAVMTGKTWTREARAAQAAKEATEPKKSAVPSNLNVVTKSKGRVRWPQ